MFKSCYILWLLTTQLLEILHLPPKKNKTYLPNMWLLKIFSAAVSGSSAPELRLGERAKLYSRRIIHKQYILYIVCIYINITYYLLVVYYIRHHIYIYYTIYLHYILYIYIYINIYTVNINTNTI